jgi:hypothetical protein
MLPASEPFFDFRGSLAGLAYPPTDSRNPALASGSLPKGRSSAARTRTHVHNHGHLHPTDSDPSTRRRRENVSQLVTNGDELPIWGPDVPLATVQIQ